MRAAPFLLALVLAGPALADEPPGRISVIGRASREVPPDFATVEVAVESRGPNPAAALDQNSTAARKVVELAGEFGIAGPDIATAAVSLRPASKTVRDPGGQMRDVPDGYQATNAVSVRVRDLKRLGALMRRLLDGGADRIGGVAFGLSDPGQTENAVRADAVRDARRQAETLAEAAGTRLGRLESIVSPPRENAPAPMHARAFAAKAAPGGVAVPIEPGTLAVEAAVEVTYQVAP
ncbi:SIMPL domain-containing protein [Methylobacterium frigidaeris]|uniref:26 kDa periplasmic immunogenic protein n=1 Tax=Methylobacterium frigidaeris TaxID=2038277 RepID=A0AA37HGA4_9HYPH|nr:SIMPL domain-containing protein [Methylobacterium frigidaeris]PIK69499.1 SIMPL domain-containing protein [Methylobacterium frigidaeris]GJD65360.1 26 kDa periplasmic immunogenic protein [Methylobacterium frigidaeris]